MRVFGFRTDVLTQVRTPCVKIMTTHPAVGAWWVKKQIFIAGRMRELRWSLYYHMCIFGGGGGGGYRSRDPKIFKLGQIWKSSFCHSEPLWEPRRLSKINQKVKQGTEGKNCGQWSTRPTHCLTINKDLLFCWFWKAYGQTTVMKIVITTVGRHCQNNLWRWQWSTRPEIMICCVFRLILKTLRTDDKCEYNDHYRPWLGSALWIKNHIGRGQWSTRPTHSPTGNKDMFCFALAWRFETSVKTMITTGSHCGSTMWIKRLYEDDNDPLGRPPVQPAVKICLPSLDFEKWLRTDDKSQNNYHYWQWLRVGHVDHMMWRGQKERGLCCNPT